MHRVLVVTGILPVPDIEYKKSENDIILVTEEKLQAKSQGIEFKYAFVFPYANGLLGSISKKWASYYHLRKQHTYSLRGRLLFLMPLILFPRRFFFRHLLVRISLFFQRRRIENLMSEFKPTVIHAQGADASASVARLLGKKYAVSYIVTLRDTQYTKDSVVRKNLSVCETAIAISPLQLREGTKLTSKKIEFIPHGVGREFLDEGRVNKIKGKKIRLIVVARLLSLKNIALVVKVLKDFKYDFEFNIYGDGPEKQNLGRLISNLGLSGKISLKGHVSNNVLPEVYKNYNVFIMPSFPETLGRVYFEAMASGLPVIGSKNTGIDGLITEGREGFLLDTFNEGVFRSQLLSILESFVEDRSSVLKMSIYARSFAKNYLWDNIIPKYLALYKERK